MDLGMGLFLRSLVAVGPGKVGCQAEDQVDQDFQGYQERLDFLEFLVLLYGQVLLPCLHYQRFRLIRMNQLVSRREAGCSFLAS